MSKSHAKSPGLETAPCAEFTEEKRKKEGRPTKTDPRTPGGEVVARTAHCFKRGEQEI